MCDWCAAADATAGLQFIDDVLVSLHVGPAVTESTLKHINVYTVRSCLVLRVLLLEARQQLNLLASNFAAARQDVADNIQLLQRFPTLLVSLQPSVHLQAGLYSQAVGAYDAAVQHFSKAASSQDEHMRVCARCLAALSYLAQGAPNAGMPCHVLRCSSVSQRYWTRHRNAGGIGASAVDMLDL